MTRDEDRKPETVQQHDVRKIVQPPALNPRNRCRECGGGMTVEVPAPEGGTLQIPCPRCAPNDAPGG